MHLYMQILKMNVSVHNFCILYLHENDLEFSLWNQLLISSKFWSHSSRILRSTIFLIKKVDVTMHIVYLLIVIFRIFWQEKKARMWSENWLWKQLTSPCWSVCTWFLKNQVRGTVFLACKNQFWNRFLQATQAVKIQFEID